jgi:hypothetical protein
MKKIGLIVLMLAAALMLTPKIGTAGEIDLLVNKLVEKGILTPVEAQILLDETKTEVAKQNAEGKNSALPKWVQTMKLKGDVRLRQQWQRDDNDDNGRSRQRVRYRLGVIANPHDDIEVGAGFASGGTDPRSTNQTLEDTFESENINLDYAYAKWSALGNVDIYGGKFKRKPVLWAPTDLLWDGDINPQGLSVHAEGDLGRALGGSMDIFSDVWFNTGLWVLDENGTSGDQDPLMHYYQAGMKNKAGMLDSKLALTYYGFEGVKGTSFHTEHGGGNNTTCTGGVLCFDYDSIGVSAEVGINEPFGGALSLPIKRLAFFGDYINNLSEASQDTGWALGFKIGDKKVKKQGQWQFKYIFANLDADAFLETFPDSDRFNGETDVRSHEYALNYALKKNVIFGLDYYHSKRMDLANTEQDLVQADILIKF